MLFSLRWFHSGLFWRQRWLRVLLALLGGVLALWAVAWAVVPSVVQGLLERQGLQRLGRVVTAEQVAFEPWSMTLWVRGLRIGPVPGQNADQGSGQDAGQNAGADPTPLLTVAEIEVNAALQSLWLWAPVTDAIVLRQPQLQLTHLGQGRWDIDDVLTRLSATDADTGTPAPGLPRFSLFNLQIVGGSLQWRDAPRALTHSLTDVRLDVPFLSNIGGRREVATHPRLAFKLQGVPFDSDLETTPFAADRRTQARVQIQDVDVAPYLPYWPAAWPVRLNAGRLGLDLRLDFRQQDTPELTLSGQVQLSGLALQEKQDGQALPLAQLAHMAVKIEAWRPLQGDVRLSELQLDQPVLHLRRAPSGQWNGARLQQFWAAAEGVPPAAVSLPAQTPVASPTPTPVQGSAQPAPKPDTQPAVPATAANPAKASNVVNSAAPGWAVQRVHVRGGQVHWQDAATASPVQLALTGVALQGRDWGWPLRQQASTEGQAQLGGARVTWQGHSDGRSAEAQLAWQGFPLASLAPYAAGLVRPAVSGVSDAQMNLSWRAASASQPASWVLKAPKLRVTEARLGTADKPEAAWAELSLEDVVLDGLARQARVGRVALKQPLLNLSRNPQGRFMFEDWRVEPGALPTTGKALGTVLDTSLATSLASVTPPNPSVVVPAPQASPQAPPKAQKPQPPEAQPARSSTPQHPSWQLSMGPVHVTGGVVRAQDQAVTGGVTLDVRDLNLLTGPWPVLLDTGQAVAVQAEKSRSTAPPTLPVKLDFKLGGLRRQDGLLGFDGAIRWPSAVVASAAVAAAVPTTPWGLQGRLQLTRFPLHRLRPYWADRVNFDLRRAELGYAGDLDLGWPNSGMALQALGHLTVDNVRAVDPVDGEALLEVQNLNARGLDLRLQAGALKHLKVSETALRDFFVRVSIDAQGQTNLQKMLKPAPGAVVSEAAVVSLSPLPPLPGSPAASLPAPQTPLIEWGPTALVNGRVLFSDQFIRPNYTADITELTGSLGALFHPNLNPNALAATALADLRLSGRVAGSGSLEVTGRINPLTRPMALDVRGQLRDLELPQLSPYSRKYAGYGIERGKLSAKVHYSIDAQGQLQATHQIVLNQLRFGERSDDAQAPNLPVKLAAALLANSQGVIDLDLPVSGSINDPDFQVGPIVGRLLLNLIGKAVLSPFSLLSGLFASESQLQRVDFALGRADLADDARLKLQSVAQVMRDKPALRLTLSGQAHLDAERDAWRMAALNDRLLAEKRRRLAGGAAAVPQSGGASATPPGVSAEEYPALLQAVYRRANLPKPRNVLGQIAELPQAEMQALLLAAMVVDEGDMRNLAQARAQQVREALLALNVPAQQLFLGAPVVQLGTSVTPFAPQVNLVVSTD